MLVICPIFDRLELLPYYLRHYTRLGATQFVMAVWNGRDNKLCDILDVYKYEYPIAIRTSLVCDLKDYNGPSESIGLDVIVAEFAERFPWYCIADLDEFCYFGGKTLPQVVEAAEAGGFTAVHGTFHDRFSNHPLNFPLIDPGTILDDLFPLVCDMTRCHGANFNKIPLAKNLHVESGHHFTSGKAQWNVAEVHHFKWSAGLLGRLRERDLYFTQQGLTWAHESSRFLHALTETDYLNERNYNVRPARKLGL